MKDATEDAGGGGFTVIVADWVTPPYVAEIVTIVALRTVVAVTIENVAAVAVGDRVMLPGTLAAALVLDKLAWVPQVEGGQYSFIVPAVVCPPVRTVLAARGKSGFFWFF